MWYLTAKHAQVTRNAALTRLYLDCTLTEPGQSTVIVLYFRCIPPLPVYFFFIVTLASNAASLRV